MLLKFLFVSFNQLEPANIFKAREVEGGEDHSTGIIMEQETKVLMCHAGKPVMKYR
jgi:hypothetical protein